MLIRKKHFDKIYDESTTKCITDSPLLHAWLKKQNKLPDWGDEPSNTFTLSSKIADIVKEISTMEKCTEILVIESIIMAYAEASHLIEREHQRQSLTG